MSTFANQDTLPALPVPALADTLRRFVGAVKVLQTDEEWAETQRVVAEFEQNEGPELQAELEAYAASCTTQSYVAKWWNDSYLTPSDSVVLNLNPFFVLADDPTPARNDQVARATSLVHAALGFVRGVRRETLPPDVWRGQPLCMSQFRSLFATARLPSEGRDSVTTDAQSTHVAVACRGQFFVFEALDEHANVVVSELDIAAHLARILECAEAGDASSAVGMMTTETRGRWARVRGELAADEHNARTLQAIDSALFLVCLDHTRPDTPEAVAGNMLHGSYALGEGGQQTGTVLNRWYDKLQLIVCENGAAGCNFEHSSVDGHTVLRFASDVFTETIMHFAQSIHGHVPSIFDYADAGTDAARIDTSPRRLTWRLSSGVQRSIGFAEMRISDLVVQNETCVLEFTDYGKQLITRNHFSPDSFVQLAMLTTYYRLYGEFVSMYEPVLTKRFLTGRTAAVRGVTPISMDHIRLWCDDEAASAGEKIASLREACQKHSALVRRSAQGEGIDRHLFALSCLWQELHPGEPLPALFGSDSGWRKLNHTVLSTSNCGNPSLRLFGFGPVVPDGYGIGYIISDGRLHFCVTSKHRQTQRFVNTLRDYLHEVRATLVAIGAGSDGPLRRRASSEAAGYGFFDAGPAAAAAERGGRLAAEGVGERL